VLGVVVLVAVCVSLPTEKNNNNNNNAIELFSIAEGLGGTSQALELIASRPDEIPRPLIPFSVVEEPREKLQTIVESLTDQGVEDAGSRVEERFSFERTHTIVSADLSRLNASIEEHNIVISILQKQLHLTTVTNRDRLQETVNKSRTFQDKVEDMVTQTRDQIENHTQRGSRIALLLAKCARLLEEQLAEERNIRERGTHMDVMSEILDKEDAKLREAIDSSMRLVQMIAFRSQKEVQDLEKLKKAVEFPEYTQITDTFQNHLDNYSNFSSSFVTPTNSTLQTLLALVANQTDVLEREESAFAITTAQHEYIRHESEHVAELSKQAEEDISHLDDLLASAPVDPATLNQACKPLLLNAYTSPSSSESSTSLSRQLLRCGALCTSQPLSCLEICVQEIPFPSNIRIPAQETTKCVTCLARAAHCIQIECSADCFAEVGCAKCAASTASNKTTEPSQKKIQGCGEILEECGVGIIQPKSAPAKTAAKKVPQ